MGQVGPQEEVIAFLRSRLLIILLLVFHYLERPSVGPSVGRSYLGLSPYGSSPRAPLRSTQLIGRLLAFGPLWPALAACSRLRPSFPLSLPLLTHFFYRRSGANPDGGGGGGGNHQQAAGGCRYVRVRGCAVLCSAAAAAAAAERRIHVHKVHIVRAG